MGKQTKRCLCVLYLAVTFGMCLIPLLAMGAGADNGEKEKRSLAELPRFCSQKKWNWDYLQELGEYFEDHFAFRQELVTADAVIRAEIFETSPISNVIVGKNGWLYYTATLDDFQHKNSSSDRMLFNIAHNVSMMQQYAETLGKEFIFTVAPNKNSLYGENMPDMLSYHIAEKSDVERLKPWLEKNKVNYVDLYELFASQDEILYYERDSHWNQKGALLVYDTLLDFCGKKHTVYDESSARITNDYYGDLSLMLFPMGVKPEEYINYAGGNVWEYSLGEKVDNDLVMTECERGSGNLLMYRDSFGNSLLPLMAGEFSKAVFSEVVPYTMTDLVVYEPDIVILEKVERHIQTLGKIPPVMEAPEVGLSKSKVIVDNSAEFNVVKEGSYWKITGVVNSEYASVDSRIFAEIEVGGQSRAYEAFCIEADKEYGESDFGFTLYISEVVLDTDSFNVNILIEL